MTIKTYGIFTDQELDEIETYKPKSTPTMPVRLRDYLTRFDENKLHEVRQKIFKQVNFIENFNPKQHYYYDWIWNSIYNMLLEYNANNFSYKRNEEWLKPHVWDFNDTAFNHSCV
ncbi:hypothetical protein HPULCUR_011640 [Helicostylum pulchrum]|uniref:Uncharacterized protein n=1 Tax=Helicostylum pulchrum TaxID=562976 RepID=A0ABP9YGN7_9FUNG